MRPLWLEFRGLTRFRTDVVRIDFEDLGPGLVAFVGPNGSGKTTTLEVLSALLYGRLPSRKRGRSLYEYATGRDAYVDGEFLDDAGRRIRIRRDLDVKARKAEAYAWVDGEPVARGKVAEVDALVAERFGSETLFLASTFAAQNKRGSILELPRIERKALFVELLGLSRIADLAGKATAQRMAAEGRRAGLAGRLSALEGEGDLEALRRQVEETRATAELARAAREEATESLAGARRRLERAERIVAEGAARVATVAEREADLRTAEARLEDARRTGLATLAAKGAELRRLEAAAAESLDPRAMRELVESTRRDLERLDAALACGEEVRAREAEVSSRAGRLASLKQECERLSETIASERSAVEAALAAIRELERARGAFATREEELLRRAALVREVPCSRSEGWATSEDVASWRAGEALPMAPPGEVPAELADLSGTCPLLADARKAEADLVDLRRKAEAELAPLGADMRAKADARAEALREGAKAREAIGAVLEEIEGLGDVEEAAREAMRARVELDAAAGRRPEVASRLASAEAGLAAAREEAEAERARRRAAAAEARAAIPALEAEFSEAARAREAEVEDARRALEAARAEAGEVEGATADLDAVRVEVDGLEGSVRAHTATVEESVRAIGALEGRIAEAEAREREAAKVREDLAEESQTLSDWTLLEESLGPNGVQALLVDAAGPAVAALTNDLLLATYGGRFSIGFETLRAKARGDGFVEDFSIRVFDGAEEREVEDLSGGEKVILGEAIALALAIHNARRGGVRWRTLFRDETAGALDVEAAGQYVAMLRRAIALAGLHSIVFVAHLPAVFEAADVRVDFGTGELPRRVAAA